MVLSAVKCFRHEGFCKSTHKYNNVSDGLKQEANGEGSGVGGHLGEQAPSTAAAVVAAKAASQAASRAAILTGQAIQAARAANRPQNSTPVGVTTVIKLPQ